MSDMIKSKINCPLACQVLDSPYCKLVFVIALILGYFLIPNSVLNSQYVYLALPFLILFALTMSCTVRNIKDKLLANRHRNGSIISLIANVVGLSVLQVCTLGGPFCGVSVGLSVISAIFPQLLVNWLADYSVAFLVSAIALQVLSLWQMGCWRVKAKSSTAD